jgi:hypothetical protein
MEKSVKTNMKCEKCGKPISGDVYEFGNVANPYQEMFTSLEVLSCVKIAIWMR